MSMNKEKYNKFKQGLESGPNLWEHIKKYFTEQDKESNSQTELEAKIKDQSYPKEEPEVDENKDIESNFGQNDVENKFKKKWKVLNK